jgi:hypothetical protein
VLSPYSTSPFWPEADRKKGTVLFSTASFLSADGLAIDSRSASHASYSSVIPSGYDTMGKIFRDNFLISWSGLLKKDRLRIQDIPKKRNLPIMGK